MPSRHPLARRRAPSTPILDLRQRRSDDEEEPETAEAVGGNYPSESEDESASTSPPPTSRKTAKKRRVRHSRGSPSKKRNKRTRSRSPRSSRRARSPRRRKSSTRRRSRSPRRSSRSGRERRSSGYRRSSSTHRPSLDSSSETSSSASGSQRPSSAGSSTPDYDDAKRGVIEASGDMVVVPAVDRKVFDTWEELEQYMQNYWMRTYQVFAVRTYTSRELRNSRIADSNNPMELLPEAFKWYNKTYTCTHAGKPRSSSGRGVRPNQHSRKIGCPAKINALVRSSEYWEVVVTNQVTSHNHPVGPDVYRSYHEARTAVEPEVLDTVRTLHRAGTNRKRILEFILENSSADPQMKDVHNLCAKLREESYKLPSIEERLRAILEDFAAQSGNIARVFSNEKGIVECISIQSSHMRTMFEQFPEVLLIDATHDTNSANYKLFSFMVHDALGKGQHVQHCLMENERKPTLRLACRQFKESNPKWRSVGAIMIDKDFTELAVLLEEFPGVRILLCHFHVVKYLQEECAKTKYNLTTWAKSEMKGLIQLLVSAPTQVKYDKIIATMKVVLKTCKADTIWFEYFDANWTNCQEMWSSIYRGNVPHMGNTTNNRLESSWQKLKTLVDKTTTLDDCVVAILFWQTVNEQMWARSVRKIGVYMNSEYDEEMNLLLNTVSRHAVELIKQQYDFAIKDSTSYIRYPAGPYTMMQYSPAEGVERNDIVEESMVNPKAWTCSCIFRTTRLLPCRHIIYYRKASGETRLVQSSNGTDQDPGFHTSDIVRTRIDDIVLDNSLDFSSNSLTTGGCSTVSGAEMILSPTGKAVLDFATEFKTVLGSEEGDRERIDSHDNEQDDPDEPEWATRSVAESRLADSPSETERQSRVNPSSHSPSETERQSRTDPSQHLEEKTADIVIDEDPATRSPPDWKIQQSSKRSGRAKAARKTRKTAKADALKQTAKLVETVATGKLPSMKLVLKAYRSGWKYRDGEALCAMKQLSQTRNAGAVVKEIAKAPITDPSRIMSILPSRRIQTAETQIAHFQNRYSSDHDATIPSANLSIKVGKDVYNVEMLKALKLYHIATPKFYDVHHTIAWLREFDLAANNGLGDRWLSECLDVEEAEELLFDLDVLGDLFCITTLRYNEWVDDSCIDECLKGLAMRYKDVAAIFTVPAYVLRFPTFDREEVQALSVWNQLKTAAMDFGFSERAAVEPNENTVEVIETRTNMWFFAAIHYAGDTGCDGDHWCGVAVNFGEHSITVFDPLKTGNRFQALRTYLYTEVVKLLPNPLKRWHFKQMDWAPQVDVNNCGVMVALFFELLITGQDMSGSDGADMTNAMQFFRFRYLSLILKSM